jgi:hypothetical protein
VPRCFQSKLRSFQVAIPRTRMKRSRTPPSTLVSIHPCAISWSANLRWYGSLDASVQQVDASREVVADPVPAAPVRRVHVHLEVGHPFEAGLAVAADRPVDRALLGGVGPVDHQGLPRRGGPLAPEDPGREDQTQDDGDPVAARTGGGVHDRTLDLGLRSPTAARSQTAGM